MRHCREISRNGVETGRRSPPYNLISSGKLRDGVTREASRHQIAALQYSRELSRTFYVSADFSSNASIVQCFLIATAAFTEAVTFITMEQDFESLKREIRERLLKSKDAVSAFFRKDLTMALKILTLMESSEHFVSLAKYAEGRLTPTIHLNTDKMTAIAHSIDRKILKRQQSHQRPQRGSNLKMAIFQMSDSEAQMEIFDATTKLFKVVRILRFTKDMGEFLHAAVQSDKCFYHFKKCIKIYERKNWLREEFKDIFIDGLNDGLRDYDNLAKMLSSRFYDILLPSICTGKVAREGKYTLLDPSRLLCLIKRCAVASAAYHHADDMEDLMREVSSLCSWEITWANASVIEYVKRLVGIPVNEPDNIINGIAHYEIPGCRLLVPAIPLLYMWITVCARLSDFDSTYKMLKLALTFENMLNNEEPPPANLREKRACLFYLTGCCLSNMGLTIPAIMNLRCVIKLSQTLTNHKFLASYAMLEKAICYKTLGNIQRAEELLMTVRNDDIEPSPERDIMIRVYTAALARNTSNN
ncbi:unnamed protein product, partial [Iphiclides podalirius]